jgi:hypothetical protein
VPAGSVSVTVTGDAVDGPSLRTAMVQFAVPPAVAPPAVLAIARSAAGPTVVVAWALSFAITRSPSLPSTMTVLLSVWPPSANGARTVTV